MRIRKRLKQNKGDNYHNFTYEDFVSRMPDEILVSILSGLTLKEAATTSVLSKRWRYLWCQTLRLDLDDDKRLDYIGAPQWLRLVGRERYINWVNQVIRQHSGSIIEDFKIHYDLDMSSAGAISNWIEFAISKNVQNLVVDLTEYNCYYHRSNTWTNFVFPNKIFDVPRTPSTKVAEIKFLKALTLKNVEVLDETISKILISCRVLEYLSIYNSGNTRILKINGKDLALTTLEIILCCGLQYIEICDSNLASFSYYGPPVMMKLNELPRLKKISMGDLGFPWIYSDWFKKISTFLNLQVLQLKFPRPKDYVHLVPLPEMANVKQLIMTADAWEDESLLGITWFVTACPNLQNIMIQLGWLPSLKRSRRKRLVVKNLHQHLEVVEISGYYGRMSDFELALYFIENSIALKKMIIDSHNQFFRRTIINETVEEKAARSRARRRLVPIMPTGVELVLL